MKTILVPGVAWPYTPAATKVPKRGAPKGTRPNRLAARVAEAQEKLVRALMERNYTTLELAKHVDRSKSPVIAMLRALREAGFVEIVGYAAGGHPWIMDAPIYGWKK